MELQLAKQNYPFEMSLNPQIHLIITRTSFLRGQLQRDSPNPGPRGFNQLCAKNHDLEFVVIIIFDNKLI